MLKNFLNIFKTKSRGFLFNSSYRVEHAFTCGGIKYYKFSNQLDAPAGRQMAALGIYDEIEMRCDKKFLVDYCNAAEKIMSQPKINIQQLALLNAHLKERLDLVPLPEFVYKLASVIYFDNNEPIAEYDYDYNQKKIEHWKAHGGTLDFFMTTPLRHMMPSLGMRIEDIKTFSLMVKKIDSIHRELHTSILSGKE